MCERSVRWFWTSAQTLNSFS